jgi:hypothetical protein
MPHKSSRKLQWLHEIFEFVLAAFDFVTGSIYTYYGGAILLFILGSVCIFSPIVDGDNYPMNKPSSTYVLGLVLYLIGILLVYLQIRNSNRRKFE